MKTILFLLKKSRNMVLFAVFGGALSATGSTCLLIMINRQIAGNGGPAPQAIRQFAGLCVIMLLGRVISSFLLVRLSQDTLYSLRADFCRRVIDASLRQIESLGAARITAALTEDIPTVANAMLLVPNLTMNVLILAGCLGYLGWLSPLALAGVLVFLAFGIVTYRIPTKYGLRHMRKGRQEQEVLFQHMRATTEGAKELKLNAARRDAFFEKRFLVSADTLRTYMIRGVRFYTAAGHWGQTTFFVFIGVILFVAPRFVGSARGILTGYTLAILYMAGPIEIVLNVAPNLSRMRVALQKLEEVGLSLGGKSRARTSVRRNLPPWKSIELAGVSHSYVSGNEEHVFQLGPIDLRIDRGEILFITGGNGSGKTTLAKVICGLYQPEQGSIRFNGLPLADGDWEPYRQNFSAVFSDFYVFDTLLGLDSSNLDRRAQGYLERLGLDHKLRIDGGALSTVQLSQGQRKRLALLTAYLEDRPIYVFDEWASDQDPAFREVFYHEILPEFRDRGKTVLVITHDDRYFHLADRLIKLDLGRIQSDATDTAVPETAGTRRSASAPI